LEGPDNCVFNRRLTTKENDAVLILPSDVIGFFLFCQDVVADLHFAIKPGGRVVIDIIA
jgi:hypothetical protein